MQNQEDIKEQIDLALKMSEDDLLRALGAMDSGNAGVHEAISLGNLLADSHAAAMIAAQHPFSSEHLAKLGKNFFRKAWSKSKDAACNFYHQGTKIDGQDLSTALVGIIVSALSISSAAAAIVVALIIKYGLDQLCPIKS